MAEENKNKPQPSPYEGALLHNVRMVVLLECKPLSNQYHQMRFTLEQLEAISKFIQDSFPEGDGKVTFQGQAGRDVKFMPDHHTLLPEIEAYYPDESIIS